MAHVDPVTKTTYATTDWHEYQQGRPPYPESLTKLILDYHSQSTGARWERLVDVGAGSGIAATMFMSRFQKIHISDPSPSNEAQARAFLTAWSSKRGIEPILEFSQSTGEDAHTAVGHGQADLVICATAAHFMDPDLFSSSCASMLRPGATVAVFSYWMPTFPNASQRLHDAFSHAVETMLLQRLANADGASKAMLATAISRRAAGRGVLDSVPFPPSEYRDVRRIYINSSPEGIAYRSLFLKYGPPDFIPDRSSRVGHEESRWNYVTGVNAEADGWLLTVDLCWLRKFFDSIRPPTSQSGREAEEAYAQWEQIFTKECLSGKVETLWPAYVALARRVEHLENGSR